MARLDSAHLKLGRAVLHFRDLQEQVAVFMASKPYGIGPEKHVGDGWIQVTFVVRRRPPIYFALLAGDAVSNANAALDHLVYGLSRTKPARTGFPIYVDPDKYVREGKNGSDRDQLLAGVREFPERAIIDAYQPYANRMKADPLWLLRVFANTDKHRIVEPGYARSRHVGIKPPPGYQIGVIPGQVTAKLKNGTEICRYRVYGPPSAEGAVPVQAKVDFSIGFGPMSMDLVEIEEALARVNEIIRAF